jgi:3-deoxy-7-phosphoheptulonate synthase
MPGAQRTAIGITGNKGEVEQGTLEEMPGVQEVIKVSKPYKLVSRDVKEDNTVIRFAGTAATIGGSDWRRLWRDRAPSRAASRLLPSPSGCIGRGRSFFAAERTSRGLLLIRFRGWARKGCKIMAEIRSSLGC